MKLEGKTTEEQTSYGKNYFYNHETKATKALIDEQKEIAALKKEIEDRQNSLNFQLREIAEKIIPAAFTIEEVEPIYYGSGRFKFKARCHGLNVEEIKKPEIVEDAKPPCPYAALLHHPELKSILNIGMLNPDEKRKIFGLPVAEKPAK